MTGRTKRAEAAGRARAENALASGVHPSGTLSDTSCKHIMPRTEAARQTSEEGLAMRRTKQQPCQRTHCMYTLHAHQGRQACEREGRVHTQHALP